MTRLGLGYNAPNWKVNMIWQKERDTTGAVNAADDRSSWQVGGGYTFGNNTIKAQYVKRGDLSGTSNTESKMWALGLDHALSKRTTVYAVYARTDNDTGVALGVAGSGHELTPTVATGNGQDPRAFGIGMIHNF
jgi:predicted porin